MADAAARRRCASSASRTSNMDEGSLRCDANVSVRPAGSTELGTKTELKNMNSFRFLERGVRAEIERQTELLEAGEPVVAGDAALRPRVRPADLAALQGGGARLPLLPRARPGAAAGHRGDARGARAPVPELPGGACGAVRARARPAPPTGRASWRSARELADYFEGALRRRRRRPGRPGRARPTGSRSWWSGSAPTPTRPSSRVTPEALASLAAMVRAKEVSRDAAREVLTMLVAEGGDPRAIVEREGLGALDGRGRRSAASSSTARSPPTPTRPGRSGRQHEGDRARCRLRDARDQGPRGRGRGHAPDRASAWAAEPANAGPPALARCLPRGPATNGRLGALGSLSVQAPRDPPNDEPCAEQRAATHHEEYDVEARERQLAVGRRRRLGDLRRTTGLRVVRLATGARHS